MSRDILLTDIDPDPDQPRQHFDAAALQELADSMAATGQAVPITVKPAGARFVIVTGERRWRAAQLLGWPAIRADVQDIDAATAQWQTLVENIQRAGLTPIEEAQAFQKLVDAGHTQTEIAKRIGKGQSYVAQKIRLLRLPADVQEMLDTKRLSEGHGRQLLRVRYPGMATDASVQGLAEKAVANGWSVKRLELEVNYQQMTHDGFWLMPIDDRWKFADLVELEKTFRQHTPGESAERHIRVEWHIGMILGWSEQIWNAGAPGLAKAMLEEFPLADVYVLTKQCAVWKRQYENDVDLPAYLRYAWACSAGLEAKARFNTMAAGIIGIDDDDAFAAALHAGVVEVIKGIDADFKAIFAEYFSQETPAELIAA